VSKNQLMPISTSSWIGQFDGRQKGELSLSNNHKDILVYVVDGAFEVQDRLLHAEDALLLNSVDVVDFEALSNEAILLIFELALHTKRG
jgi:redox-sensitive bicupin YhaK (pirin superfamily)